MLNLNSLMRLNATIEAKKQLIQNIGQIKVNFKLYDPYIQAVLIQSVVNLTEPEFGKISNDFHEIIDIAKDSPNEWVRRKAFEFSDFPKIKIDTDINDNFDISSLENFLLGSTYGNADSGEIIPESDEEVELLDPDLKPPSSSLKPPVPLRKREQRVEHKAVAENPLSIPSAPRVQRPPMNNQQPYRRPNESPSNRINLQPQVKKKEKKVLSELPDFMLSGGKKRK